MTGINPLDWYGGAFLALYALLYAMAVVAGFAIAFWLRPEGREVPTTDEDELAMLAGGPNRLAETVLARLLARGEARIENGKVWLGAPAARASAAEREITALSSPAKWRTLQQRVTAAAQAIERQLVDRGLMMERSEARGLGLYAAIPLVLLLGLGAAKLVVGVARDRPIGFLVALLVATVIALLFRVFGTDRRTRAGMAMLKAAQQRAERLKLATTNDEAGTAVALFGTAVLVGSPMAELHRMRQAGDGGGGGDGGSSSDGGSGDGGGCGGCGS